MASLIPGYAYDIFVSYRPKDNLASHGSPAGDGWVTEFVNNLRKELEATFNEDISIYFDNNPHYGLNETHDLDESLKGKVKCLIFIPIISQTYCDPGSFAWKNEFLPFINFAREDQFGLKVKDAGGNVINRVVPVQIHDLDPQHKLLFAKALGATLRPVEFIYRSAAVNRPLQIYDEYPKKNVDNTFYPDQINKVAKAVAEIITGLTNFETTEHHPRERVPEGSEMENWKFRSKVKRVVIFIAVLLLVGLVVVQGVLNRKKRKATTSKEIVDHSQS